MEKRIKFETIRPVIDKAFEEGKSFSFKPNGISMKPFIKGGKDVITIEKYRGGVKKFDVVFYVRDDGRYVLHRVVKIKGGKLFACGDNAWWLEPLEEENIFAILTRRNSKNTRGGFLYLNTLFVRRFVIHVKLYINKHFGVGKK